MNIYTGNFANVTKYRGAGLHPISISLSARYFTGDSYRPLNPERVFMNDPDDVYTPKFNAILAKLDVNKVVEDLNNLANGKDIILLCHEGGDYEAQNLIQQQMFNRSTTLDNTTKAPLLGMCCYKPFFFTNFK